MLDSITHEHLRPAYDRMYAASTLPLWEIYGNLITREPSQLGDPWIWRYRELRPLLVDAGSQISQEEAERRVLALKNPGLDRAGITPSLFAGLQLVLPGEVAASHRHSQAAIRFVFESSGGYTAVQGERCQMRKGDFITTPAWCWHDHKNDGDGPMIWLDGLDVPLVGFFGARFAEENENDQQPIFRSDDNSASRWGAGMKPFTGDHVNPYSPIFTYPYDRACESLMSLENSSDPDPHEGWKMVYSNPVDGGHVLPTIAAFLQKIPAGMTTRVKRSTESTVFAIAEGRGSLSINDTTFDFEENDTLVAPNWTKTSITAQTDTIIFSFSDRAPQELLGLFRDEKF